jgi:hypothetical protein
MFAARGIVVQECKSFVNKLQALLLSFVSTRSEIRITNKQTNTTRCHGARIETRVASSAASRNLTLGEFPKVY